MDLLRAAVRLAEEMLAGDAGVGVRFWDGTEVGPSNPESLIVVRSPDALRRLVTSPGELGFGRAFVAGEIDVEGPIWPVLSLRHRIERPRVPPRVLLMLLRELPPSALLPPRRPAVEARLGGRRHSPARDSRAIAYHYDLPAEFYRLFLGENLTYSCAVFASPEDSLEDAQFRKNDLVCRKLGLAEGMRLLDVGCGWGTLVIHAAKYYGVHAVGVTLSQRQADFAQARARREGVRDLVEIRHSDWRDVEDGPYDAIASVGMFEHVGKRRTPEYFQRLRALLRPGGRLLNHAIARTPGRPRLFESRSFIQRYVFPDGELQEIGSVVTAAQKQGLEVRHVESLREHYALTLRRWVENLESNWDAAVRTAGHQRARIWRLYMAASAVNFEDGKLQIHQTLAVRPAPDGTSGLPLRPDWEN
ncbi:MAG: cyclopropane-fatty-acyl-phospholipid synthase [Acidimicrobiales bacterium]|nr:MAG: cyclopropane-fatty-acyl-phospholipid synthase [Acidimicrobiales bacterium]